jgi:hypothetical protein
MAAPEVVNEAKRLKKRCEFLERQAIGMLAQVDQLYAERSGNHATLQAMITRNPELVDVLKEPSES